MKIFCDCPDILLKVAGHTHPFSLFPFFMWLSACKSGQIIQLMQPRPAFEIVVFLSVRFALRNLCAAQPKVLQHCELCQDGWKKYILILKQGHCPANKRSLLSSHSFRNSITLSWPQIQILFWHWKYLATSFAITTVIQVLHMNYVLFLFINLYVLSFYCAG